MMLDLSEASGNRLYWSCSDRFTRTYELSDGEHLFAVLVYHGSVRRRLVSDILTLVRQRRAIRPHAIAKTPGGEWKFSWRGFVQPRIEVTEAATGNDIASARLSLFGWRDRADIQVETRRYRWFPGGAFGTDHTIQDDSDNVLLRVIRSQPIAQIRSADDSRLLLEVEPAFKSHPKLSLLALLALYLEGT
jgi:hypothetical protein